MRSSLQKQNNGNQKEREGDLHKSYFEMLLCWHNYSLAKDLFDWDCKYIFVSNKHISKTYFSENTHCECQKYIPKYFVPYCKGFFRSLVLYFC